MGIRTLRKALAHLAFALAHLANRVGRWLYPALKDFEPIDSAGITAYYGAGGGWLSGPCNGGSHWADEQRSASA